MKDKLRPIRFILKNVDVGGWHSAINADGPNARVIASTSHVALSFYWPALGRQPPSEMPRATGFKVPGVHCRKSCDSNAQPLQRLFKISAEIGRILPT